MKRTLSALVFLTLVAGGCSPTAPVQSTATTPPKNAAGIANPAAVNCAEKGYVSEIRTAADGSQAGVCKFPDGSECDEWAFFRNECGPGTRVPQTPSTAYPAGNAPVSAVQGKLAEQLSVDASKIALAAAEANTWPDACLGLAGEGEIGAATLVPGYRVVLTANGTDYSFRTNEDGSVIRPEPATQAYPAKP